MTDRVVTGSEIEGEEWMEMSNISQLRQQYLKQSDPHLLGLRYVKPLHHALFQHIGERLMTLALGFSHTALGISYSRVDEAKPNPH